jgi:hypothetical protein
VTLRPGDAIDERWELPFAHSLGLAAVGSARSAVRAVIVEARDAREPEFLDMSAPGGAAAEYARRGRGLRLEEPVARVVNRPPTTQRRALSMGQLYDRLLRNATLRRWLAAQPVRSWRSAQLLVLPDDVRFKAITTRYKRAVTARARPDASDVHMRLPQNSDRARTWARGAPTLPPGIALAPKQGGWTPTADVIPEKVRLPSGRIVVGEYLLDAKPLAVRARPGVYQVRATLARYKRNSSRA